MGSYTEEWNSLTVSQKDCILVMKILSFTYGGLIPYEEFSEEFVKVIKPLNGKESIGPIMGHLYAKGYAEPTVEQIRGGMEAHCIKVTDKGIKLIFTHQDIIERWRTDRLAYVMRW